MGSNGVACGSPTPFEGLHLRASLCWGWVLALTLETQLMVMAQPALPAAVSPSPPSSEPQLGARISASPH